MKKNTFIDLSVSLLVLLFVYTSFSKLIEFKEFQGDLSLAPYIGQFAVPISILIPIFEIAASILLLFGRARKIGLYTSLLLLSSFTIYLILMLSSGSDLPCSCGGVISKLSWKQHVAFNIFFVLLTIISIRLSSKQGELQSDAFSAS